MSAQSERYQAGAAKFEEVYPRKASEDPAEFERMAMENLFSEYWSREGLSTRAVSYTHLTLPTNREV